jgi:HD-GYP domain-containing protein (c-di-GMP phosphodiesterase class II)
VEIFQAFMTAYMFDHTQDSNAELIMASNSSLEGLGRSLELRNTKTDAHTWCVTDLAIQLAQEMNLEENDIILIYMGALLHDIGKTGVPDSIML